MIGKPSPRIPADVWLNTPTDTGLSPDYLKGKAYIIAFLSPRSKNSHNLAPVLSDLYSKYQKQGLEVIGCTKLYGIYKDEIQTGQAVTEAQEIELIKQYLRRNRINHPVAVSTEGLSFEAYKVTGIPALFFVDRKGNINNFRSGFERPEWIINHVKKLLEEK